MILTNYYGYRRVNDFSAEGSVFDHRGGLMEQKTDLPIIVINWLNGQMIARETNVLPIDELNKVQAEMAQRSQQDEAPAEPEQPPEPEPDPPKPPRVAKKKTASKAPLKLLKKKKKKIRKKQAK